MIRLNQLVRTLAPVTVWGLTVTVLDGEYVVEKVRGRDVRVDGVWVPFAFVEVVR